MKASHFSKYLILLSVAFYVASLSTPAFAPDYSRGFGLLLFGPLGVLCGEFAWLANPSYAAGALAILVSYRSDWSKVHANELAQAGIACGLLSIAFASLFALQTQTLYGEHPVGVVTKIERLLLGYWFWVSCMISFSFAAAFRYCEIRNGKQ